MLDELYPLSQAYLEMKLNSYQREILPENAFHHRFCILLGQRGVGKTTLLLQFLLHAAKQNVLSKIILYLPVDHFLLSGLSLYEIAEAFAREGGKYLAFDEIHKYENWSQELKSIYETFPELSLFVSGSSALEIHKGSHDLTRRAAIFHIPGLSFREFMYLQYQVKMPFFGLEDLLSNHEKIGQDILKALSSENKILPLYKQYCRVGFYPYFLEIKDEKIYWMTLEQNYHTTIETDLLSVYPSLTGNSIRKIKQLMGFIASSTPFTANFQKLKTLLDIGDERTIKTYFKYLEDVGLIRQVMGASSKLRKLELPEKIYLDNPNQMLAISPSPVVIGTIRELFFLSMLSYRHRITIPLQGDFLINEKYLFEIGGKNKTFAQIKNQPHSYLVCDEIEKGIGNKIPLWLFGMLY